MDKKSKILIWIFVVLTLLSVGYTFYKTVILQDFEVIDTSGEAVDGEISEESEDLESATSVEVDASISEEIIEE
jgi:flagellar basal body-associated protein FliL